MISKLGMADRVAALLTICTPHRGSSYADWVVRTLIKPLDRLGMTRLLPLDIAAIGDLTRDRCARFNADVPDEPSVAYYSIACVPMARRVPIYARHAHGLIRAAEGDNDGLVSLASARWGRHLATWPIDHVQAINSQLGRRPPHPNPDVSPRYLKALEQIAREIGQNGR